MKFLPMPPESLDGKKVFGFTAQELDMNEEDFGQLVDNMSDHVTC